MGKTQVSEKVSTLKNLSGVLFQLDVCDPCDLILS